MLHSLSDLSLLLSSRSFAHSFRCRSQVKSSQVQQSSAARREATCGSWVKLVSFVQNTVEVSRNREHCTKNDEQSLRDLEGEIWDVNSTVSLITSLYSDERTQSSAWVRLGSVAVSADAAVARYSTIFLGGGGATAFVISTVLHRNENVDHAVRRLNPRSRRDSGAPPTKWLKSRRHK